MLKQLCIILPTTLLMTVAQAQTSAAVVTKPGAKPVAAKTAAAPAAATSVAAAPAPEAKPVKFSMSMSATYEVQALEQTNATTGEKSRNEAMAYDFSPAMSFGDGYRFSGYFFYTNSLTDSQASVWADPQFTLSRKAWELGKYFRLGPSGTVIIPATDNSRDNVDLKYGVAGKLSLSLNTKNLGLDDLSASYAVQYTRWVTDFATNAKGDPVTQHRFRQDVSLGYQLIDSLSASLFFRYENRISAENVSNNDQFVLSQSLEYSLNDTVSLTVGHSNSGAVLNREQNYQGNLKFFDNVESSYSLSMGISL